MESNHPICPKCGMQNSNVTASISNNVQYTTCRNCNRSSNREISSYMQTMLGTKTEEVEDTSNSLVETFNSESEVSVAVGSENILEETIDPSPFEDEEPIKTLDSSIGTECPKCGKHNAEFIMATAKLAYILCPDCGYDSKAEGKRHKV